VNAYLTLPLNKIIGDNNIDNNFPFAEGIDMNI
jgi:hypothetical protein